MLVYWILLERRRGRVECWFIEVGGCIILAVESQVWFSFFIFISYYTLVRYFISYYTQVWFSLFYLRCGFLSILFFIFICFLFCLVLLLIYLFSSLFNW